jgi:hypothetical protein
MFILRRTDDGNYWHATCEKCGKEFSDRVDNRAWGENPFVFLQKLQTHWETRNLVGVCSVVTQIEIA